MRVCLYNVAYVRRQVLDPTTQRVDYQALYDCCRPGTLHEYVSTLHTLRATHRDLAAAKEAMPRI